MNRLGLLLLPLLVAVAPAAVAEDSNRTLGGSWVWEDGNSTGDLEAVFKPTGEGAWDVDFRFEFRGKGHVYSGSAKGSLSEGRLEGRVQNENGQRTWVFTGTFADGTFTGTHSEIVHDGEYPSGTLTLH